MSSLDEYQFLPVPVELIDSFWDAALKFLQPAIATAEGKVDAYDIYSDCQQRISVLWLVVKDENLVAAVTTRIINYPQARKGYAIEYVGGRDMKNWIDLVLETLKPIAKQNGCTHFEAYGRSGWRRWLGKRNFEPKFIHFEMELEDG